MKYSNKNVGKEKKYMIPLEIPELDEKKLSLMSQSFDCPNPRVFDKTFSKGIFSEARRRFGQPLLKTGFVHVIADTRMSMPNSINNLLDGNKKTNWLSTNRSYPQLTFYFPFHLVTVDAIGLRSHFEPHFPRFLENFIIEAMNDDKEWVLVNLYLTRDLSFLGAKTILSSKLKEPIRAIRIVNCHHSGFPTKFGLSMVEIFGKAEFNKCKYLCSENTFRDLTYSLAMKTNDFKAVDNYGKEPQLTIKAKLWSESKKWKDETDHEDTYNKELFEFMIDATDKNGPSLIQKYEDMTGKPISIFEPKYTGLISYINSEPVGESHQNNIDFNSFIMEINEIKITTDSEPGQGGIIVAAIKFDDKDQFEPYTFIDCTPCEPTEPNTEIFFKFPEKVKYTAIKLFSYYGCVNFKKVDIYGIGYKQFPNQKYIENKKKCRPQKEIVPCLRCIPPHESDQSGDIFAPMKQFYGPTLCGFVYVAEHVKQESQYYLYYFIEEENLFSDNPDYPVVCLYFYNNQVQLEQIQFSISKDNPNKTQWFVIEGIRYKKREIDAEQILFNGQLDFTNNNTTTIDVSGEYFDQIDIASDHPFWFEDFKFIGKTKIKEYDFESDENFISQKTQVNRIITNSIRKRNSEENFQLQCKKILVQKTEKNQLFVNEIFSQINEDNLKLVYSAPFESEVDLLQYGTKNFSPFHNFFNKSADKDLSLYTNNENNVWIPSKPNDSAFTIVFLKHAIKMKGISIKMANDGKYAQTLPSFIFVYGYSAIFDRWDVTFNCKRCEPIKVGEKISYEFKTRKKNNLYKAICFYSSCETLALSYFKLFGELYEDNTTVDLSKFSRLPAVSYKNMPVVEAHIQERYSPGLFESALTNLGHSLTNFVIVNCKKESKDIKDEYIWKLHNRPFKYLNTKIKYPKTITFYFPHHVVYLEGFIINTNKDCPITRFGIGGSTSPKTRCEVIWVVKGKQLEPNVNVRTKFSDNLKIKPLRTIQFYGLERHLAFNHIDFFGYAIPSDYMPLSEYKCDDIPPDAIRKELDIKPDPEDISSSSDSDQNNDDDDDDDDDVEDDNSSNKAKKPPKFVNVQESKLTPEFTCKYCGCHNRSINQLLKGKCNRSPGGYHKLYQGNEQNNYLCKFCGCSFKSINEMSRNKCSKSPTDYHVPYSGKEKLTYPCKYCGHFDNSPRSLCSEKCSKSPTNYHVLYAGEVKLYYLCKYCGSEKTELSTLTRERCNKSPYKYHVPYAGCRKSYYQCKYCNCEERSLSKLCNGRCRNSPYDSHIAQTNPKHVFYCCKYCGTSNKSFKKLIDERCKVSPYGHHVPYVGEEMPQYICKFCGKLDNTKKDLCYCHCKYSPTEKHVPFACDRKSEYVCKFCGSVDKNVSSLCDRSCSKSPTGNHVPYSSYRKKEYGCKYCGKYFDSIKELSRSECNKSPNGNHVPYSGDDNAKEFMCKYCLKYGSSIKKLCTDECSKSPTGYHVPNRTTYYKI